MLWVAPWLSSTKERRQMLQGLPDRYCRSKISTRASSASPLAPMTSAV